MVGAQIPTNIANSYLVGEVQRQHVQVKKSAVLPPSGTTSKRPDDKRDRPQTRGFGACLGFYGEGPV